ncbi:sensor histidine kinase [Paenibacillus baekrokdamisoli]|uniref:histidine kinase n=1 Tax=Paenibacillus baekrokdamisoli TaxID=1712516 RepID=A0A3G9JKH8_9BACL|nr:sensor histidine kinase [Paenibacillus baekrokdamisoli]MBB3071324.1 two-component sensor histidine kinase [Paenibacillus baekrokdamisoli]BBH24638.1 sensor histidine kinase [Paenibacillus baekrokdamisoli]
MIVVEEMSFQNTTLTKQEAESIMGLAGQLQWIADVSQSDMFIDCPLDDESSALVIAQAHPSTAVSLYKTSVVGQYAYVQNEPAVMFCLLSGKPVIGSRGTSQEGIAMQQNVIPIHSKQGKVIGALIMEKDISEKLEQEKNVERLIETTEQLSETLLSLALSEGGMQSLMQEGIVLFDENEWITYTNPQARKLLMEIGYSDMIEGSSLGDLFYGKLNRASLLNQAGVFHEEFQIGNVTFELKALSIYRDQMTVGGFMLIRDLSELKEKEKQLIIKSAVIKEIHHRVKNNLQTVSGLLRLQMRRTQHEEVQNVYRDSINRINSIAIIHEMLAFEGIEMIPFKEVAERIAKNIISSSVKPDQSIRAWLSGDELILPSEQATTLALVINELVQNCVIHAFQDRNEGEIEISLQVTEDSARLRVSDNGCGINNKVQPDGANTKGHIGLKISETLVQENLAGQMSLTSDKQGTKVEILFPLPTKVSDQEDGL